MKTAKEMFEQLGFEIYSKKPLIYKKNDGGYITQYDFNSSIKRVVITEWEEYNNNLPQGMTILYIEHFKAIHKQMEELGWLDVY